ncbi:hypothetical protein [Flammeovirga pacifica]|nr:hypothetical protein [Flammeovirga pacifica]
MRYFLLIPILLFSCEEYKEINSFSSQHTNIISASDWDVDSLSLHTNYSLEPGSYSTQLEYGPGKVDVNFYIEASSIGEIKWHNTKPVDKTLVKKYFEGNEDIFFLTNTTVGEWKYKEYEEVSTVETFTPGFLIVGEHRIKTKIYEDDPTRIYCTYENRTNLGERTYRFQIQFYLTPH